MSRNHFTPEQPPKGGKVKKLWDWWITQRGHAPAAIWPNRPKWEQKAAGVANYVIEDGVDVYLVCDVDEVVQAPLVQDPYFSSRDGGAWLD